MPLVFDRTLGELSVPRLDRRLAAAADRRVRLDDLFVDTPSQWNCEDAPSATGRSCVVAIDTGVCTPAILTVRDDEEWLLWLRMPRTTWQQREASTCPSKLWTRSLSKDESSRLLERLQPSIVNASDVLHPHLVSTLLGILALDANQNLLDLRLQLGGSEPAAPSSVRLRLVALPPQSSALEQCLTVLTHRRAFVVADEDDEADVPLTQRITDHVLWAAPSNGAATAALAKTFNDEHTNLQSMLQECGQPSVSLAHVLGPASTQEVGMEALVRYVTHPPFVADAPTMTSTTSELAPSDDDDDDDPKPRIVPTFPQPCTSSNLNNKTKPKKRKHRDESDESDDDSSSDSSSSVSGVSEEEDDDSEEEEENETVKDDDSEDTTVNTSTSDLSRSHGHDAERLATLLKTHGESFSTLRRNAALAACQAVAKGDDSSYSTLLSYAVGFLEDALEQRPDGCVSTTEAARAAAVRLLTHTGNELPAVAEALATLTNACVDATLVLKQN